MRRDLAGMPFDEESDAFVICAPNGKDEDGLEGINGIGDCNSSVRQEAPHVQSSDMDEDLHEEIHQNEESHDSVRFKKSSTLKSAAKPSVAGSHRSNYTVPQPFTLSTEKRAAGANRAFVAHMVTNDDKYAVGSSSQPSNMKVASLPHRKSVHLENSLHHQDDDTISVTSSTATSSRVGKAKTTVPVAPTFRLGERLEKRKEFYTKLEEKHKALEAEKLEAEARKKEEQDEALRKLRASLIIKAKPMPTFYQEGPPAKVELKKVPPTRAISPKLTRRKSCSDAQSSSHVDITAGPCGRVHRHSLTGDNGAHNKAVGSPRNPLVKPKASPSRGNGMQNARIANVVEQSAAANAIVQT